MGYIGISSLSQRRDDDVAFQMTKSREGLILWIRIRAVMMKLLRSTEIERTVIQYIVIGTAWVVYVPPF